MKTGAGWRGVARWGAVSLAMGLHAWAGETAPVPDPAWLDAAPFARLCTWDPQRTQGVRAGRVEEMAAEDLFLATELPTAEEGTWHVPRAADGRACVGLQWYEGRLIRTLSLTFAEGLAAPALADIRVEAWNGATLWQGQWQPLAGRVEAGENGYRFTPAEVGVRCQQVRWILPAGSEPLRLSALTTSPLTTSAITLLRDPLGVRGEATLGLYNATFVDAAPGQVRRTWDQRQPLDLRVRHVAPAALGQAKGDRGSLRLRLPDGAFAVALDDVLERGPVFVPHVGLWVFPTASPVDPAAHRLRVVELKTVLEEVRANPEQTRERSMRVTHYNPRLDRGRLMLSLACDNAKFVTEADGALRFYPDFSDDAQVHAPAYELVPVYGGARVLSQSQGWGRLGLDRAAHADPARAMPLRIQQRDYVRGLGHHASGELVFDVSAGYDRFEAEIGLQWQGGSAPGSVVFEVWVDGQRKYSSGVMRESDPAQPVCVPLAGAHTLSLRLEDAGDGIGFDTANWAEARLVGQGQTQWLTEWFRPTVPPARHLADGWLPAPVLESALAGIEFRQRTYVVPFGPEPRPEVPAWLNGQPLAVVELTLTNRNAAPTRAQASFLVHLGAGQTNPPAWTRQGPRTTLVAGGQVLASFDGADCPEAEWTVWGQRVGLATTLPAGGQGRCYVYLPAWQLAADAADELRGGVGLFERFQRYWAEIMAPAMQIELPDAWLADVIRANQVHLLLAARNENRGERMAPWIASDRYRFAIDSEGNSVIRGLLAFGHFDFARRAFEYYFSRYRPEGYLTTGYTLMGNGWHLWTLGEYVRLAEPDAWYRSVAEKSAGLCRWVIAQLEKTRRNQADGQPVPEYGLMPPGVQADWDAYAYYFCANGHFLAGLEGAGRALARVEHPDAAAVLAAAQRLRGDLVRAFARAQAMAPVVRLRNGAWVPYYPSSVYTPGPMADYYPGQDANRSWCYDVELGSHHLVALGALPALAPAATWMLEHMEDVQFLEAGWGGYPAARNQAEWFDLGGFAKVQPYYARNAEVYALRDEVRPFLRSYFNALASLVDGTALSIFEHFSNFCYNKTHETGYFLQQSRTLLVTERDQDLWLAPLTPSEWLRNGKVVSVRNAPTYFGPVSYRIESAIATGRIEAAIDPPTRTSPRAIVLRLRHPDGQPMRLVTVNGKQHATFDPGCATITLPPDQGRLVVRADY